MLFPITLKKAIPVEEFVNSLNQAGLTGGTLKVVTNNVPLAPGYIVFQSYEDTRCAVSVAVFSKKLNSVNCIKAVITDISSFENQMADSAIAGAIGRVGGNLGMIVADHASGMAAKRSRAKKLVKTTNNELKALKAKLGW